MVLRLSTDQASSPDFSKQKVLDDIFRFKALLLFASWLRFATGGAGGARLTKCFKCL